MSPSKSTQPPWGVSDLVVLLLAAAFLIGLPAYAVLLMSSKAVLISEVDKSQPGWSIEFECTYWTGTRTFIRRMGYDSGCPRFIAVGGGF